MALQSGLSPRSTTRSVGGGSPGLASSTQSGGPEVPEPLQAARAFRQTRVQGKDLARSVDKVVKGLRWFESLNGARSVSAQRGRPILWIQGLGDLDGYC